MVNAKVQSKSINDENYHATIDVTDIYQIYIYRYDRYENIIE